MSQAGLPGTATGRDKRGTEQISTGPPFPRDGGGSQQGTALFVFLDFSLDYHLIVPDIGLKHGFHSRWVGLTVAMAALLGVATSD